MNSNEYPHLQAFLSGWFHQDFDVAGDSIEAIANQFKQVSTESEIEALAKDIRNYTLAFGDQVESTFDREFQLDIEPTAFAPSVTAFLVELVFHLDTK